MKRTLSILLTILMVISLLPAQVLAVESVASGSCGTRGENVTWVLSGDGTLTISGTGEMEDYYTWNGKDAPWDREAVKRLVVEEGVTTLGGWALRDCTELTEVSLPQSLETIGSGAFWGCTALTEITVPEGVQDLGADMFVDCSGLKRVTLPNSIVETGGALFSRCTSLTNIVWPEKLSSVGWCMFNGCTKLESIELPRDLKTVANEAFEGVLCAEECAIRRHKGDVAGNIFWHGKRSTNGRNCGMHGQRSACSSQNGWKYKRARISGADVGERGRRRAL